MPTVSGSTTIDAPVQRVWDLLADLKSASRYSSDVKSVQLLTEAGDGVGAARECATDGGAIKERVVGWRPNEQIAFEIFEAPGPLHSGVVTFTMAPSRDGSTILTCTMDYRMRFGALGVIMAATIAKPQIRKMVNGLADGVKSEVEARRPSHD